MKLNETEKKILIELFTRCHEHKGPIGEARFYADFHEDFAAIKRLISRNLIVQTPDEDTIRLSFLSIFLVDENFVSVYHNMARIFNALKQHYIEHTDTPIALEDFANTVDLSVDDVEESLLYLQDALPIGYNLTIPEKWIMPLQSILGFDDFDDLIYDQKEKHGAELEAPDKRRHNQLAKMKVQAIAKTLWLLDSTITITDIVNSIPVLEYADAARYSKEKTIHRWIAEVDPRQRKKHPGPPTRSDFAQEIINLIKSDT